MSVKSIGSSDIYLRLLGDLGLDETILIEDEANQNNKTVPDNNDHT